MDRRIEHATTDDRASTPGCDRFRLQRGALKRSADGAGERRPAAADWRDRDRVVGEWGPGDLLPLPPPAVRRPAAAALHDRCTVEGELPVAEVCLLQPQAAWRPAGAVSVNFRVPPPPAVRHPAAAA